MLGSSASGFTQDHSRVFGSGDATLRTRKRAGARAGLIPTASRARQRHAAHRMSMMSGDEAPRANEIGRLRLVQDNNVVSSTALR